MTFTKSDLSETEIKTKQRMRFNIKLVFKTILTKGVNYETDM